MQYLIDVTQLALWTSIDAVIARNKVGHISAVIQCVADENGIDMVRELISHSIRREMYENPKVLNYDIAEKEPELKLGVTLAVEPTSTIDKPKILVDSDGGTKRTIRTTGTIDEK